jgi:hypothetical protein
MAVVVGTELKLELELKTLRPWASLNVHRAINAGGG